MTYTNLVLSAGGVRGFAFAGALDELVCRGILDLDRITTFSGTSIGAMVCCMLAIGYSPTEILREAHEVDIQQFLTINLATVMYKWGLDDQTRLRAYLASCVLLKTGRRDLTLRELLVNRGKRLHVCAANLTLNKAVYFTPGTAPDLPVVDAVMMSMAIPPVFPPVRYQGALYVDGAFLDSFPTRDLDPKRTLGIRLQWEVACDLNSMDQYLSRLAFCALSNAERAHPTAKHVHIIDVHVGDVSTVNFSLPPWCIKQLIRDGRAGVGAFIPTVAEEEEDDGSGIPSPPSTRVGSDQST